MNIAKNRIVYCLCIGLLAGAAMGVHAAAPRETLSLNGTWKFYPAFDEIRGNHSFLAQNAASMDAATKNQYGWVAAVDDTVATASVEKHAGWILPGFDDAAWWDIPVPGSWNTAFEDLWSYEGHGWYRKEITIPPAWEGKQVIFHSDGANYRTVLYVNGQLVGTHEGGYTAFQFPIQDHLVPGKINTIAILVDNESKLERVPMERHDWWVHGGLFRPVWLEATAMTHIADAVVVTERTAPTCAVTISAQLVAGMQKERKVDLTASLINAQGEQVTRITQSVTLGAEEQTENITMAPPEVTLWTPETPYLYTMRLELTEAGTLIDTWERRIGLRTIEIKGNQLLLNGNPYQIKGVNRYEDYAETGGTSTPELLRKDLELVKALGANAIRCHYPNSPATYALCDEIGLLAACEVPLYQWGRPGHSWKNAEAAASQLREMILTLRNHPSVAMWSVSNENRIRPREPGEEHKKLSEMVVEGNSMLVDLTHELDPTRPVIEPSNRWPEDVILDKTDICSVNIYIGTSAPQVDHLPEMADQVETHFAALRERFPEKPILVTEFGSWALYGLKTDYFPGETFQAELIRTQWEAFAKEENYIGCFLWVFADSDVHRKYTRLYEMRCAYGLYNIHRQPKEAVAVVRELWKE